MLEPVAGAMLLPFIFASTAYGDYLTSVNPAFTNKILVGLNVVCWCAQFIGHGFFERRAPALLDNLVQALVLAPFFVWMELLFMFGYRPELRRRVEKAVEKEVIKFKEQKSNGISKGKNAQ